MRKFFMIQSGVILVLVYVQEYVEQGTIQVAFQALGTFLVLISMTFALALIISAIRKLMNHGLNFADSVIRISIFVLPVYYVAQLMGWLYDKGLIGGKG